MLEKNKDYIEMRVSSTDCAFTQNAATTISIKGFSYNTSFRLPDPGESYVIISKEKFDQLQTENEELKKKLQVPDPFADYKELLEKLHSKEDVEKFEWTLNHICGGQASANGWMITAKLWRRNYETLSKLVGFSSTEEIQDYLTNEAECDTLQEAVSKLKDQVKYTCDEWYSTNSRNNSWKAAAECNSPKELIEKRKALEKEIDVYSRTLKEWKEGTGCPSPSSAKALIESGVSWHHAYNEIKEKNRKLEEEINELRADYSHLLCTTGFESEGEIEDALDKCDHSTLRKALVDYEFDYETLLKLTGYKSEQDIRVALNYSEQFVYETMRELINSLKRKAKFTESGWKEATGCDTPDNAKSRIEGLENAIRLTNKNMFGELERSIDEWQTATGCVALEKAQYKITDLYNRIDKMKEAASIASNWIDKIVEG